MAFTVMDWDGRINVSTQTIEEASVLAYCYRAVIFAEGDVQIPVEFRCQGVDGKRAPDCRFRADVVQEYKDGHIVTPLYEQETDDWLSPWLCLRCARQVKRRYLPDQRDDRRSIR